MFKGLGTALITPFKEDGSIDINAISSLVASQIEGGVDTLVVMGTTGESATMTKTEKAMVLDHIQEINAGRLNLVYGIGGNNTAAVTEELQNTNLNGVDGILSVSPYYNKPTQNGIYEHYKQVASSTDLPIILYNVPGRTASNVSAETTLRLAEIPNIVAMKEASGDLEQIMTILQHRPEGFLVLSGDDAITLPLMSAGVDGVISVVSNAYPSEFSKMVKACANNQFEEAKKWHYLLFKQIQNLFKEGNPAGVKEVIAYKGIGGTKVRLPLVNVSNELKDTLIAEHKSILAQ